MIKVNLIPKEERKKVRAKRAVGLPKITLKGWDLYASLILLLISIFLVFFINFNYIKKIKKVKNDIQVAKQELTKLQPEVELVNSLESKQKQLNILIELVKNLNLNRSLMIHVIDEINKNIPDYMWLTDINIVAGTINISGITFSNLIVTQFMQNLENSNYISNITLIETKYVNIEEHNLMQFSIRGNVHPAGGG